MQGEANKRNFIIIESDPAAAQPTLDLLPEITLERCRFQLPVLADSATTEDLKNDVTAFYRGFDEVVTTVVLKLFRCDIEVKTLNNDDYGTFYSYGFHEDDGKKYIGYQVDWRDVLLDPDLGEGEYYIKAECTTLLGGTFEVFDFIYCLKQYTAARADKTVRVEFTHNGYIGSRFNDEDTYSFKDLEWYNSIRLPQSFFGGEKSEYELEFVQYTNGQWIDTKSEQTPNLELQVGPVPYEIHKYLKTDVVQADTLEISDYNQINPMRPLVKKKVKFAGAYEPNWNAFANLATVVLRFEPRYNLLRKKRC